MPHLSPLYRFLTALYAVFGFGRIFLRFCGFGWFFSSVLRFLIYPDAPLRTGHPDVYRSELVLWNNKEITIENKSIFWAHLFEKGICFVQDLLDENGKFLSLDDLPVKYNVHPKFLQYFQLIAAIRSCLKKTAQEIAVTKRDLYYLRN